MGLGESRETRARATAMMSHVRLGAEVMLKSFGGAILTGCVCDMHRRNACGSDGFKRQEMGIHSE